MKDLDKATTLLELYSLAREAKKVFPLDEVNRKLSEVRKRMLSKKHTDLDYQKLDKVVTPIGESDLFYMTIKIEFSENVESGIVEIDANGITI